MEKDFLNIWMEFDEKRRKREEEPSIRQGEELEELVQMRASYINDLIHALSENYEVLLAITNVLEDARRFCTGESEVYPFMAYMQDLVEQTPNFTLTFYPLVNQARSLLIQKADVTLLRCVKQTMDLEKAAIELGDKALHYIGLFEQLVLEGDDTAILAFVGDTCRLYFELKDMNETLLHRAKQYEELNRIYMTNKVIDYNRYR